MFGVGMGMAIGGLVESVMHKTNFSPVSAGRPAMAVIGNLPPQGVTDSTLTGHSHYTLNMKNSNPYDTPASLAGNGGTPDEGTVNAVALAAAFFTDKRYTEFYQRHGKALAGFPGCWRFIAEAAESFTRYEQGYRDGSDNAQPLEWDGQFVAAVGHVIELLYTFTLDDGRTPDCDVISEAVEQGILNAIGE